MAEKHKSKWKAPKDEAKSQKAEARKDLKDYTAPDAHGMVPNLVSGVQPLVARKYATEVIDNIENMVPEIKDRLYKKVEEGEYSAEQAAKVFIKLQTADTDGFLKKLERIDHGAITNSLVKPENEESIKESISKLSEAQKEQLVRKYIRKKITKVLVEQNQGDPTPPVETPPVETPPAETPETPVETPPAETPETPVVPETPETPVDPVAAAAQKKTQAIKDFTAVLATENSEDTIIQYVETALGPLVGSMNQMEGKKFRDVKHSALKALRQITPTKATK